MSHTDIALKYVIILHLASYNIFDYNKYIINPIFIKQKKFINNLKH